MVDCRPVVYFILQDFCEGWCYSCSCCCCSSFCCDRGKTKSTSSLKTLNQVWKLTTSDTSHSLVAWPTSSRMHLWSILPRVVCLLAWHTTSESWAQNINQNTEISINVEKYQSILRNINQYWDISINIEIYQSILRYINQHWDIYINIEKCINLVIIPALTKPNICLQ